MKEQENYNQHILKFTNLILSKQEGQYPISIVPEILLKNNKQLLDLKINMKIYGSIIAYYFGAFIFSIYLLCSVAGTIVGCLFVFPLSIILTYYLCKHLLKIFTF